MKNMFRLYRRYLKAISKQKGKYILAWIFVIILLTLNNISILAIGKVIDSVEGGTREVALIIGLIALILALPIIFEPIAFYFKTRVFASTVNRVTADVYNHVLSLDYNYHANKQTGKIISMIINSQDVVSMFLWQLEWFVIENLAALVIPIILIAFISPEISVVIAIILLLFIPIVISTLKLNVRTRKVLKNSDYERNTAIVDGMSNFETVRSFGTETRETAVLKERLNTSEKAMNKYQNTFRIIDFLSRVFGVLLFVSGAGIALYYYDKSLMTIGAVVVVVSYLIQMTGRLMNSVFSFRDVMKNLPVAEDFYELMDASYEIHEDEMPISLNTPQGKISFKNVTFNYENNPTLLSNLSFDIEARQNIALVGPSGGGKSTITRLLMRYYDVNSGSVSIDGVDVRKLSLDSLRDMIGIVPQEPVMFNRSILYNVGYALENISDDSEEDKDIIVQACKRAHIHEFIESLPDGYKTFVGERGVKLSGGQKQRLAIARILIKDPKIVIFDEATSMLDSESERAIQKAFRELSKEKTTIIIAHRLSTIIHCDNILVIDKGKVVESGRHDELVKAGNVYAKLWEIQSGGFVGMNQNSAALAT